MHFIKNLYQGIDLFTKLLVIISLSLMVANVTTGVFFRYVLGSALAWTEELARYLMVWFGYLGMSMALKDDLHVGITFILERFSPKARAIIGFINRVIIMVFLFTVFKYSLNHLKVVSIQRSPSLEIPMFWPYLAVTVGTGLMMLENLRHMILIKFK